MKLTMKEGATCMKYLKIESDKVYFLDTESNWQEIDILDKNSLLYLLDKAIEDDEFEMDEFDESNISHKAHQIIYKSIYEKFTGLLDEKTRFKDESRLLYRDAFEKYTSEEE